MANKILQFRKIGLLRIIEKKLNLRENYELEKEKTN
jgi:hypothetical protein